MAETQTQMQGAPQEDDQQAKLKNQNKRDKVKPIAYLSLAIFFEVDFYYQIAYFFLTALFMLYKCKFRFNS